MQNTLEQEAKLHPDLRHSLMYLNGYWMIHNPVMVRFIEPGKDADRVNHEYTAKLEHIAKAKAEADWDTYMILHERAYRIDVFDRIKGSLSDKEYWKTLGWVYTDQEFLHNQLSKLRRLLQSPRPCREFIMPDDDRASFAKLPDELRLYRGYNKGKGLGWSWT